VGLFYFSGHGVQHAGNNYLIPINSISKMSEAVHLNNKAVPANYVLAVMQNSSLNIVILDACRDNPFKGFSKSLNRGLTRMASAEGSLIAYATAPGTVAWTGKADERNSPYTKHLLRFMKQPNLSIESMLKKVRKAVIQETRHTQTVQQPWYEVSISNDFYFIGDSQIPTTPATQPPFAISNPLQVVDDTAQKIAKLLKICQYRFDKDWLTSGGTGTALDCYKDVLMLDPNNLDASRGLVNIENRYVKWAERTLKNGEKSRASQYLARLRQVNSKSSKLAVLESQLESRIIYLKDLARKTANRYEVDVQLIFAIIQEESQWNPDRVSHARAIGLMQLIPSTGKASCQLEIKELFDPVKNLECGVRYFKQQLIDFQHQDNLETVKLALCAYNAGPYWASKGLKYCRRIKETKGYMDSVIAIWLAN
jgi:hypothetical protein